MQLPKYNPKNHRKNKLKVCHEPGCGKEFWGHPIAKYCEIHQDIKLRKRKRRIYEEVDVKNQIYNHKFHEVIEIQFNCQLPGCNKPFKVKVYPKQYVYSKFCEEHRSEYKRINFIRNLRTQKKESSL